MPRWRANELGEVDTTDIEDTELRQLFAAFGDAATLDPADLPPLPPVGPDDRSRLARSLHATAHLVAGNYMQAISILSDSLAEDPRSLSTKCRLAEAHLTAAKAGLPQRVQHLEEQRRLALEVRDDARPRRLPIRRHTVEIACQAAFLLGDWPAVVRLGVAPPDGEADDYEASGEETVATTITSALFVDRTDLIERLLPELPRGQAPSLYRAQLARLRGDVDEAQGHIRNAGEEVTDWGRAVTVLLAWARELDDPLPQLAAKGIDSEQAQRNQEMAEILRLARTSPVEATARMRSFVDANAQLGSTLIEMVELIGDSAAALATAEQILSVRDDPEVHEYLALAMQRAHPPNMDKALEHALAFAAAPRIRSWSAERDVSSLPCTSDLVTGQANSAPSFGGWRTTGMKMPCGR